MKEEDYIKFRNFVKEMFRRFCEIEEINFENYERACHFLNPINSKYYKLVGDGR